MNNNKNKRKRTNNTTRETTANKKSKSTANEGPVQKKRTSARINMKNSKDYLPKATSQNISKPPPKSESKTPSLPISTFSNTKKTSSKRKQPARAVKKVIKHSSSEEEEEEDFINPEREDESEDQDLHHHHTSEQSAQDSSSQSDSAAQHGISPSTLAALSSHTGLSPSAFAGLLGLGGMRGMSGSGVGMMSRFKDILLQLKNKDANVQLVGLQELADVLSVATEDMFVGSRASGFSMDELVKALLSIIESPASSSAGNPNSDLPAEFRVIDDSSFGDFDGMGLKPELILLSCRCLSNLIEALPSSILLIVQNDGTGVLIEKLLSIEYIDLAEQIISVLLKISMEYPSAVIKANGLLACLQYIDFFNVHVQRNAVSIAANACKALGSVSLGLTTGNLAPRTSTGSATKIQGTDQVIVLLKDIIPILGRLLTYSDNKILEQSIRCLGRIIEWSFKFSEKFEDLIPSSLIKTMISLVGASSTIVDTGVFNLIVKGLGLIARGSGKFAYEMCQGFEIIDVIINVLTDGNAIPISNPEATTPSSVLAEGTNAALMNFIVNKPVDHVLEVLTLACEILPVLPGKSLWDMAVKVQPPQDPDDEVDIESEVIKPAPKRKSKPAASNESHIARLKLLHDKPLILKSYFEKLVPLLVVIFSATVNHGVRRKVVECVVKVLYFSIGGGFMDEQGNPNGGGIINEGVMELLPRIVVKGLGNFISELIGRRETAFPLCLARNPSDGADRAKKESMSLVSSGVLLTNLLITSGSSASVLLLSREGVFNELKKILVSIEELQKEEKDDKLVFAPDASSRSKLVEVCDSSDGNESGGVNEDFMELFNKRGISSIITKQDAFQTGNPTASLSPGGASGMEVDSSEDEFITRVFKRPPNSDAISSSAPQPVSFLHSMKNALERMGKNVSESFNGPISGSTSFSNNTNGVFSIDGEYYSISQVQNWIFNTTKSILETVDGAVSGDGVAELEKVVKFLSGDHEEENLSTLDEDLKKACAYLQKFASLLVNAENNNAGESGGITGYELLESGIVVKLIQFLSYNDEDLVAKKKSVTSKEKGAKHSKLATSAIPMIKKRVYSLPLEFRKRCFLHVFSNIPSPVVFVDCNGTKPPESYFVPNAFRNLVLKCQEIVSRMERYEVLSALPVNEANSHTNSSLSMNLVNAMFGSGSGSSIMNFGSSHSSIIRHPSYQLSKQMRVQLVSIDNPTLPSHYQNNGIPVNIHAAATFKQVEDFLKGKFEESFNNLTTGSLSGASSGTGSTSKISLDGSKESVLEKESKVANASPSPAGIVKSLLTTSLKAQEVESSPVDKDGDVIMEESTTNNPELFANEKEEEDGEDEDEGEDYEDDDEDDEEFIHHTFSGVEDEEEEMGHEVAAIKDVNIDETIKNSILNSPSKSPTIASAKAVPLESMVDSKIISTEKPKSSTQQSVFTKPVTLASKSSSSINKSQPSNSFSAPPPKIAIEFTIGDMVVTSDMTVFSAVFNSEKTKAASTGNVSSIITSVWNQSPIVKYRAVVVTESDSKSSTSKKSSSTDSTTASLRPTLVDKTQKIIKNSPTGSVLGLLRVLSGLNASCSDIHTEEDGYFTKSKYRDSRLAVVAEGPKNIPSTAASIPSKVNNSDEANASLVSILPATCFQNNKLTAKLNKQLDEPLIVVSRILPPWCSSIAEDFSFLVPFESRLIYLQSTSFGYGRSLIRWQQNVQSSNDGHRNNDSHQMVGRISRQKVRIYRSKLLESMMKVMEIYGSSQSLLEVEFFDEVGSGLGPTLEFYTDICKLVRLSGGINFGSMSDNAKIILWRDEEKYVAADSFGFGDNENYVNAPLGLFPLPMSKSQASTSAGRKCIHFMRTLGSFVAKALYDSRIIDLPFNPLFLGRFVKKSIDHDPSTTSTAALLHDIKLVDPSLRLSLLHLAKYVTLKNGILEDISLNEVRKNEKLKQVTVDGSTIEDLCLDFTLPGYPDIELVPNGSSIVVSLDNVEKYIGMVVDMTVGSGIQKQVDAFRSGFDRIFSSSSLSCFSVDELSMIFGADHGEDWSYEAILESIKTDHGYTPESKTIKNLVTMLSTFDKYQRRAFLQFVTGALRLPIGGFKSLQPRLTVVCKATEGGRDSNDYLPSVMTCVNYLKVPDYTSLEVMQKRFEVAIQEGKGSFHLS